MSFQPMSDDRHQHLVKCAEKAIGLMNVRVSPNAALAKVAKDEGLSSNEVTLVAHAINNSKTVAHLQTSKAEDKGKPFTLTNAELVNKELYSSDPVAPAEEKADEKAAKKNAKGDSLDKKEAAARSRVDLKSYLDVEAIDHAPAAREAFGTDTVGQSREKIAFSFGDDLRIKVAHEQETFGPETKDMRRIPNPFSKLAELRHTVDEASLKYSAARDAAHQALDTVAGGFRRTDAPSFATVEKIARSVGVDQDTIDLVYVVGRLEGIRQTRAPAGEKLAGQIDVSVREKALVDGMITMEKSWKEAADWGCLKDTLQDEIDTLDLALSKKLAEDSKNEVTNAVNHASTELSELPDKLMGHSYDRSGAVNLLGSAADTIGGEPPKFKTPDESPFDVGTRQTMQNLDGRSEVEGLLGDEFIGKHPVQDVVAAYNRAKQTNPGLSHAQLGALVKQDLGSGGAVPFDTLMRAGKTAPAGQA